MRKIVGIIIAWLPPFLLMGIIFFLSSRQSISISTEMAVNFSFFKTLHVLEYALLTFLFFRALFFTTKLHILRMIHFACLFSIMYSITDEFHQTFVPTRTGQPRDVFIDALGILCVAMIIYKKRTSIKKLLSYTTL